MAIPTSALTVGRSMRERGIDREHVAALAEVVDSWTPILVNRPDLCVIDGHHRVAAAQQVGLAEVPALLFDGSADDAFREFVRRNVSHGLPLSLSERRTAARRILRSHADSSDRAIASECGLSPKTIGRLRDELASDGSSSVNREAQTRVGRDGRVRPLDARALRARIAEELKQRPDASLRQIARVVGASPETVRSVRNEGRVSASTADAQADVEATVLGLLSRKPRARVAVRADRAFADHDGGEQFIGWFETSSVEPVDLWRHVSAVPLSRVYDIADEARRRARFWAEFAEALEGRVRRRA